MNPRPSKSLEVWGGIEPTVRRVADEYFDQLERTGHAQRLADLDLIAALGLDRLRYPVLWERVAPDSLEQPDWRWTDQRLARLQELEIPIVAGLLHHGSGPRYTELLDPGFPEKLARYARLVAERYPWVDMYTPVNEPLTTARFSCLYGLWYPQHREDFHSFGIALLNQCRGTVLAMREIRRVNSRAALVQTEDLGKMYSTPLLSYQADLENERRWLTHDLLTGTLTPDRAMWRFLIGFGIDERELGWFLDNPLPPDILGINTYVTSERLIVEELAPYPPQFHGGNALHRYSDIEAVRVSRTGMAGHLGLLREAWQRSHLPLAVTEVQLAGTREEQLRWLHEAWTSAGHLRSEGVDIRAIGCWSLFGGFEWNSLLTQQQGFYENGAFDVRAPRPRPTAVAAMVRSLAGSGEFEHPVLAVPGWWRRPQRVLYKAVDPVQDGVPPDTLLARLTGTAGKVRPLLITGATGTLGQAFGRLCEMRALPSRLTTRGELDIADEGAVGRLLDTLQPWAVVNTAGYVRVDEAEADRGRCMRENVVGPQALARACAERGLKLLTFSSDMVFDGVKGDRYVETDAPHPLSVYGESKEAAERAVLGAHPGSLVIRASAFFGPWDAHNFVFSVLRSGSAGRTYLATEAQVVSPTYVPDLVNVSLDLLIDDESGIWHLANVGETSWLQLAREVARRAGFGPGLVRAASPRELGWRARRPRFSVLGSERGWLMPRLASALDRYFAELSLDPAPAREQQPQH